jgi:hypothetical protein
MDSKNSVVPLNSRPNKVGFADKPALGILRFVFPGLAVVMPEIAARISLRIFLSPPKHKEPSWEHAHYTASQVEHIDISGKRVAIYRWGDGTRKVLLCHAWGGRGTQLATFVEPLIIKGYSVIAFDAPGHGRSEGKMTDMMEYSAAVNGVVQHVGGVYALIAHSFGAGNAVFSKTIYGFDVRKIALIGCFAHGVWITEKFGELLNIPSKVIARMRSILEVRHNYNLNWKNLDIVQMVQVLKDDVLIVHDRNDHEIPYFNALEFKKISNGRMRFITTEGLGHRRIVRNLDVVAQVCQFVSEE